MFEFSQIEPCLVELVGFRNHRSDAYSAYDSSIIATPSNGKKPISHPLINVETIASVISDFNKYDYEDWEAGESYSFDERIYAGDSKVYKSLVPGEDTNTGNDPVSSPDEWGLVTNLSLYLEALIRDSAEELANDVVLKKKNRMETKSLLSKLQIYQGSGKISNKVNKNGRLVGFQINLKRSQNLKMLIDQIGTQFDTPQTIRFYLYHSSQTRPIQEIDVDYSKSSSFQWTPLTGVELDYFTSSYGSGGAFYLMYDENAISGQAINYQYDFSNRPCGTCNGYNIGSWNQYYKFFKLSTVVVSSANRTGVDGLDLWDIDQTAYVSPTNFGLNLSVTLKCDIGDLICQESYVFKDALAQTVVVKLLEEMTNSTRDNDQQTKVQSQLAIQALNGEAVRAEGSNQVKMVGGEREKYKQYLEALNFDLSNLNDVCTPCTSKAGIKYKTLGY